jgi:hypothetical protein
MVVCACGQVYATGRSFYPELQEAKVMDQAMVVSHMHIPTYIMLYSMIHKYIWQPSISSKLYADRSTRIP